MTQEHENAVQNSLGAFLKSQFDKKTKAQQKQLAKAIQDGEHEKAAELRTTLTEVREQYRRNAWLADAAERMARQLTFGTHFSKAVHSEAKGDNINFKASGNIAAGIIGTQSAQSQNIDANGNAAALPLAAFFDFDVNEGLKIRDLILQNNPDFISSLSQDENIAVKYHKIFKSTLENKIRNPVSHERNKQIIFPIQNHNSYIANYKNIVPLHSTVLAYSLYQRINLRYTEENTSARNDRFKKNTGKRSYFSIPDLAVVQLGGTKPQNVSLLTSRQSGRNYLLPSIPPKINRPITYKLSKFSASIFDSKALEFHARKAIQAIFDVVESERNSVDTRNARKVAIDEVLHILFSMAEDMRNNLPAGWSKDYKKMSIEEKLWLDPMRVDLEGEEDFKNKRESEDWIEAIVQHFADWLNGLLKKEFKAVKHEFSHPDHLEWEREIEAMKKQYERMGRGVFL